MNAGQKALTEKIVRQFRRFLVLPTPSRYNPVDEAIFLLLGFGEESAEHLYSGQKRSIEHSRNTLMLEIEKTIYNWAQHQLLTKSIVIQATCEEWVGLDKYVSAIIRTDSLTEDFDEVSSWIFEIPSLDLEAIHMLWKEVKRNEQTKGIAGVLPSGLLYRHANSDEIIGKWELTEDSHLATSKGLINPTSTNILSEKPTQIDKLVEQVIGYARFINSEEKPTQVQYDNFEYDEQIRKLWSDQGEDSFSYSDQIIALPCGFIYEDGVRVGSWRQPKPGFFEFDWWDWAPVIRNSEKG